MFGNQPSLGDDAVRSDEHEVQVDEGLQDDNRKGVFECVAEGRMGRYWMGFGSARTPAMRNPNLPTEVTILKGVAGAGTSELGFLPKAQQDPTRKSPEAAVSHGTADYNNGSGMSKQVDGRSSLAG